MKASRYHLRFNCYILKKYGRVYIKFPGLPKIIFEENPQDLVLCFYVTTQKELDTIYKIIKSNVGVGHSYLMEPGVECFCKLGSTAAVLTNQEVFKPCAY